jgi:hypothetical protein
MQTSLRRIAELGHRDAVKLLSLQVRKVLHEGLSLIKVNNLTASP